MWVSMQHHFKYRVTIVATLAVWLAIASAGCSPEISSQTIPTESNSVEKITEQKVDLFAAYQEENNDERLEQFNKTKRKSSFILPSTNRSRPRKKPQEYTQAQLHKNQTLLVLTYDSVSLAKHLMYPFRWVLTEPQIEQCEQLTADYKVDFERLLDSRTKLLENTTDKEQLPNELMAIRIEVIELVSDLRLVIRNDILNAEQREELASLRENQKKSMQKDQ